MQAWSSGPSLHTQYGHQCGDGLQALLSTQYGHQCRDGPQALLSTQYGPSAL